MDTRRFVRFAAGAALGAALLLAPLAAPSHAEDKAKETTRVPLLWEVQTKPKIYLFGTIHLADVRVTTHPPVVLKALAESEALYTELDFATMGADLAKHIMLPTGKTLADFASGRSSPNSIASSSTSRSRLRKPPSSSCFARGSPRCRCRSS